MEGNFKLSPPPVLSMANIAKAEPELKLKDCRLEQETKGRVQESDLERTGPKKFLEHCICASTVVRTHRDTSLNATVVKEVIHESKLNLCWAHADHRQTVERFARQ
jgi:hypothetical protein